MINALEKVIYPNGKTKAIADLIPGSVSAIIDEVHTNTSAITTINNKLLEITAGIDYLDLTREVVPSYEGVDLTTVFADEISEYSDEWAWINHRVNTGNFYGIHVGDYIPVESSEETPHTYKAEIMGINTYKGFSNVEEGNHIDWCFREAWSVSHAFNKTTYNNGVSTENSPFMCSDLNYFLNSKSGSVPNGTVVNPATTEVDYTSGGVKHYLPTKLKAVITPKRINAPRRYDNSALQTKDNSWGWTQLDDLWIPSEQEVAGCTVWATPGYGNGFFVQYPLFANSNRRSKRTLSDDRATWWTLSAVDGVSDSFGLVSGGGAVGSNLATTNNVSIIPCFRTGEKTLTTKKKAVVKKKGETK